MGLNAEGMTGLYHHFVVLEYLFPPYPIIISTLQVYRNQTLIWIVIYCWPLYYK